MATSSILSFTDLNGNTQKIITLYIEKIVDATDYRIIQTFLPTKKYKSSDSLATLSADASSLFAATENGTDILLNSTTVKSINSSGTGCDIVFQGGDKIFVSETASVIESRIDAANSSLTDAPSDGEYYGRLDATWAAVQKKATNEVIVTSLADLPTPASSVITLADDTVYKIIGNIDIEGNRLVMGSNTTVRGTSPAINTITSTTTDALITASGNFRLWEIGFSASSGEIFDLNGTGSEICLCIGVRFFGNGGLGVVDQYDLFEINIGLFVGFATGLTFTGANGNLILVDTEFFQTSGTATSIDLGIATFNLIRLLGCSFTAVSGGTSFSVAANGGNLNSGKIGTITACTFNGAGIATTGYSSLDGEWAVSLTNVGIIPSDRLLPTGWAIYNDGESSPATQSLTTTFQKLQIDGLGGTSNSSRLPISIRGIGELWDTTNDEITPITEGDSYNLRIDLEITAKGGGASSLFLQLDIGGGATPSIVVVDTIVSIAKSVPFTVNVSFPIFSLSTFITNGGQIFIATDSGTATLASRGIFIQRVSSGAI